MDNFDPPDDVDYLSFLNARNQEEDRSVTRNGHHTRILDSVYRCFRCHDHRYCHLSSDRRRSLRHDWVLDVDDESVYEIPTLLDGMLCW
jgi:hypothetical protein